jgi:hypothetical protein
VVSRKYNQNNPIGSVRGDKMNDKETIRAAFFALAGSRSPSLTKKQQEKELAKCWELLAEAVYREDENESR